MENGERRNGETVIKVNSKGVKAEPLPMRGEDAAGNRLVPVGVECGVVEVGMGINIGLHRRAKLRKFLVVRSSGSNCSEGVGKEKNIFSALGCLHHYAFIPERKKIPPRGGEGPYN